MNNKLSVVLATFNEELNLPECLDSVKGIASEIVIVDGGSQDKTVEVARSYGASILVTDNPPIFHINKQKALDMAKNSWILQLDADERISPELGNEILHVISLSDDQMEEYQKNLSKRDLFFRHQNLLEERDGTIGVKSSTYQAFFIPRLNYFLGRYLKYGGVYPDGVIRLVKKENVHFPCISVHEQMEVNGKVGWLENDLIHKDSPTFARYLARNNKYISLLALELREKEVNKNPLSVINYMLILPTVWFLTTFIRHKGFLDSWQGFIFSLFSSLRFPRAYLRALKYEVVS